MAVDVQRDRIEAVASLTWDARASGFMWEQVTDPQRSRHLAAARAALAAADAVPAGAGEAVNPYWPPADGYEALKAEGFDEGFRAAAGVAEELAAAATVLADAAEAYWGVTTVDDDPDADDKLEAALNAIRLVLSRLRAGGGED